MLTKKQVVIDKMEELNNEIKKEKYAKEILELISSISKTPEENQENFCY